MADIITNCFTSFQPSEDDVRNGERIIRLIAGLGCRTSCKPCGCWALLCPPGAKGRAADRKIMAAIGGHGSRLSYVVGALLTKNLAERN